MDFDGNLACQCVLMGAVCFYAGILYDILYHSKRK